MEVYVRFRSRYILLIKIELSHDDWKGWTEFQGYSTGTLRTDTGVYFERKNGLNGNRTARDNDHEKRTETRTESEFYSGGQFFRCQRVWGATVKVLRKLSVDAFREQRWGNDCHEAKADPSDRLGPNGREIIMIPERPLRSPCIKRDQLVGPGEALRICF